MKKVMFSILITVTLLGCFSPWRGGDQAKITLVLSGGTDRAAFPPSETMYNDFEHMVELSKGTTTLSFHAEGGTTIEAIVSAGQWDITVETYLGGEIYAAGSARADLQPGNNDVISITMYQAFLVTFDANGGSAVPDQIVKKDGKVTVPNSQKDGYFIVGWYIDEDCTIEWNFEEDTVTGHITLYAKWEKITEVPGAGLAAKLEWLNSYAQNNSVYIVKVYENENIEPQSLSYDGKNVTITIMSDTGNTKWNITLNSNGTLFTVDSGVTLLLENITLQGHENNDNSFVSVNSGGSLVMNVGSEVTDNTASHGGGVYVGGTFTMNGGEISGNTATDGGGGVSVDGTFTMNGGEISRNNATQGGGGVSVDGTFTMNGGEISGNNATQDGGGGGVKINGSGIFTMNEGAKISDNEANYGGGVSVDGTFTMNDGEISENIAASWGGGGVYVSTEATFTMKDGTISDNTSIGIGGGVLVWGGSFNMEDGIISDNTTSNDGGGVHVAGKGTFAMTGGTISHNTTTDGGGGGVHVWEGIFNMEDGIISGNTANYGGGVNVGNGTFHIFNGIIYGSNEGDMSNTASLGGAALCSDNSTAQYGIPNGSEWDSNGDLITTDGTIVVEEGWQ
jgi:uncharacterized repeat protein (TIGR02543 family)